MNVLQWGHFARRRDTPGAYPQGLGVEIDPGGHVHADALVQPGRAGQVLGVDAETDAACTPPVQLAECVAQQSVADTFTPVLPAGPEDVDPPHPEELALALCSSRNGVAGANEEAELVLERACADPLLVRTVLMAPVILERFLEDLMKDTLLAWHKRHDTEPLRPRRRIRLVVELDHHAKEAANGLEPTPPEEARGPLVLVEDADPHLR